MGRFGESKVRKKVGTEGGVGPNVKENCHLNAETALTAISRQKQTKLKKKKCFFGFSEKKERKVFYK